MGSTFFFTLPMMESDLDTAPVLDGQTLDEIVHDMAATDGP